MLNNYEVGFEKGRVGTIKDFVKSLRGDNKIITKKRLGYDLYDFKICYDSDLNLEDKLNVIKAFKTFMNDFRMKIFNEKV